MDPKTRNIEELHKAIFTPESIKFGEVLAHPEPGEEVVVSGIAGSYPESENVTDFQNNLFNKYDMVNDDPRRWKKTNDEIPQRTGKLLQIDKFDSGFFDFHHQQSDSCDPILRLSMEKSFEALLDAGINPKEIQGTRTGIFLGTCFFEIEKFWLFGTVSPYSILTSRSIITQRLAYYYGLNSTDTHMMDTACSSSCFGLDWAYRCIRDGRIDMAIVGGANLCLSDAISLKFARLGVLSKEGVCRVFDQKANGYVRSESNVFVILQKAKDARRIYCRVVHSKVNSDGYKEEGITFPSGMLQQALMEQCYQEAKMNPNEVAYVEAHGTGTKVGDPEETRGLEETFCKGRKSALPIGSVKSNIGHSEPAAGLNSLTKVIIAMETGYIPPNINFETPNKDIPGFFNGKLRVVCEAEPLKGDLVALNSFGFGGANAHAIVQRHNKIKKAIEDRNHLPYLVTLSGRTEDSMISLFDGLSSRPVDREYIRLFHSIHTYPIPGHLYKGYLLLNGDEKVTNYQFYSGQPTPQVAIFSGLDKGWARVGRDMLKLPLFTKCLEDPAKILLETRQFDLFQMFRRGVEETTMHSIVAAVAVQIALVNILEAINIKFDHYAGISYGEIVAGYAEGVISVEEALLTAHSLGQLRVNDQTPVSQFILIGNQIGGFLKTLDSKEIQLIWQYKDVVIIQCEKNNHQLIHSLENKGFLLFKNDLSFWSLHRENKLMDILSSNLKRVSNEEPILSSRWIRTNFSLTKSLGKISFLQYLIMALVKVPKIDHLLSHISENNSVVEFSLTGLISKIFSLNTTQFGMENKNNLHGFLINLGKLFEVGAQPKLDLLYPTIQYPVSRGTPMIAPLIKWDHTNTWFYKPNTMREFEVIYKIDINKNTDKFYTGHVVDGRNLFPASGYLYLVWVYLKMDFEKTEHDFPIIFENIRFVRASHIPKNDILNLNVSVNRESGLFQIMENSNLVVTGKAYCPKSTEKEFVDLPSEETSSDLCLNKDDLYKELKLRGYHYADLFQGLLEAKPYEKRAMIEWRDNWVTFIDIMLQSLILSEKGRGLFVPISIERIVIDPNRHEEMLKNYKEVVENENSSFKKVPIKFSENLQIIQSGGVEIRGFYFSGIQRRKVTAEPVLEKYCFVQYEVVKEPKDWKVALRILTHILLENQYGFKIKIIEFANEDEQQQQLQEEGIPDILSEEVSSVLLNLPLYSGEITILGIPECNKENLYEKINSEISIKSQRNLPNDQKDFHLVILNNLIENPDQIEQLVSCLAASGMLLLRVKKEMSTMITVLDTQFDIISRIRVDNEQTLILFNKKKIFTSYEVIEFNSQNFSWISEAKRSINQAKNKNDCGVIFVSENEDFSGLLGFYNCISKEESSVKMQCVLITDRSAPKFDITDPFYQKQIEKHVAVNVLQNGIWGSYRHMPLKPVQLVNSLSAYIDVTVRGDLSSMQWIQDDIDPSTWTPKAPTDVLVQVHYCSLNFRDIMMSSGKLANSFLKKASRVTTNQGLEFSGRTLDGRRVFGLASSKAMSTYAVAHESLMWEIPENMSMEDAATIPVIYCTCIYALIIRGHLKPGETVLIHAGTGGIGQAAINIALENKCRVLATCAPHKKQKLLEIFPGLDENDIGNSRDCSFYEMVMERTNGRGVDIVLNSLAEEKLIYGLKCLAPGGRFVEIGKYDLSLNVSLNLDILKKGISFHGVMLDQIMVGPDEEKKECKETMSRYLSNCKSITRTVFQKDDPENAFRYMASGKHIGKVLIQVRSEDAPLAPIYVPCVPRVFAKEQKSYIVIGGLGGFGLELVNWLINRNAYKLILNSRSGVTEGYQASRIEIWRKELNATIVISNDDITSEQGVETLLMKANQLGPVGGIFNLAVNLKDNLFENQNEESFQAAAAPKALATRLLDQASRRLCPELEHFVVFSSVSCGRGNISQTNYGMANSVMERIIENRKSDGFPGLAVEWGAVGDVGLVAKMQGNNHDFTIGGTLVQGINSCLACLDNFMLQSEPIVSSMVVAEKINFDTSNPVSFVAHILSLNLKTISYHATLAELGMDSMMGVEIKQGLEREFGIFLSVKDLRSLTFAKLLEHKMGAQEESIKGGLNEIDERTLLSYIDYFNVEETNIPIMKLNTKKSTANPIFILPGVESHSKPFEMMADRIDAPVYFIQLNCAPYTNLKDLTAYLLSLITNELRNLETNEADEIRLIGYSLGSSILYCLVQELESLGHRSRILFIDGSPKLMNALLGNFHIKDNLEPKEQIPFIESSILIKLVETLSGNYNIKLQEIFEKLVVLGSWAERVEFILNNIQMKLPVDKISLFLAGVRNRLVLVFLNNHILAPESLKLLESPATLIRIVDKMVNDIEDDYGLGLICKNFDKVHIVEGDHKSILESEELSNIINQFFLSS